MGRTSRAGRVALLSALAALSLACGSRSAIRADAGATTSSTTTSSGGTGPTGGSGGHAAHGGRAGAGGSGGPCEELVLTGEPVSLASLPGGSEDQPRLNPLPDGRAAVMHHWQPANLPVEEHRIVSTVVTWLDGWPPEQGDPVLMHSANGWSFAVDRDPENWVGMVAGSSSGPPGLSFAVTPVETGPWAPNVDVLSTGTEALFVHGGEARYFVGMQRPSDFLGAFDLYIGTVHQPPNGITYDGPFGAGCAGRPIAADAVETTSGWLLARAATSTTPCADDTPPGPADLVNVTLYTPQGPFFGLQAPLPAEATELTVIPSPAGGWVVAQHGTGAVTVIGMDADGQLTYGPSTLASAPDHLAFGIAAAAIADGGVVAFVDDPAGNPPDLRLISFDGQGAPSGEGAIEDLPILSQPPSVLADPTSGQLLVAYSIAAPDPDVMVARFDCR